MHAVIISRTRGADARVAGEGKERLDKLVVDLGLAPTRSRAQAMIMAGDVRVDGRPVGKAGTLVPRGADVSATARPQWASRGAHKLLGAFEAFPCLRAEGRACVDVGASTGGFTDVLLTRGARRVFAVDVGRGQLLWRLASDPRVTVMDRTNARELTAEMFDEPVELLVCDASFISLRLILPAVDRVLCPEGEAIVLIKPQFEAGRERLARSGAKGVVRDPVVHADVLREVLAFAREETALRPAGLTWSPIKGPSGNIEFLCHLTREDRASEPDIDAIVRGAWRALGDGEGGDEA